VSLRFDLCARQRLTHLGSFRRDLSRIRITRSQLFSGFSAF